MLVKDVMRKAKVVDKSLSLEKASKMMEEHNISSLIVMYKNKIVGMVTHDDVVGHFGKNKKISEIMIKNIVFVRPNDDTTVAMDLMKQKKISILPVLSRGRLMGIISARDLLTKTNDEGDFLFE